MTKQKKVASVGRKPAEDQNQQPLVSVVIPTHNVEGYVDACIASIKRQTHAALEVILIDDGSSDSTVEVIRRDIEGDSRFTLLQQSNQGPGAARNAGLRKARGKYLSFIDADDVAEPVFIERMVASLEKSGSDLAVCNVWRLRNGKLYEAELFKKAIPAAAVATHIKHHPSLAWDTVVWNKLYRLNFYLEKVGFFPEGILYEDMPPATMAHLRAKNIDILDERLYCWRYRTEETSITQNKFDLKNLVDRLDVMESLFRLYKEECPSLLPEFEKKQLENDLLMYLRLYPKASDDFKRVCAQRVPPLLQSFSPQSIKSVAVGLRLFYTLASLGRLANVGRALDAAGNPVSSYKVTQEGGRLYAVLPFSSGWDALPRSLFDVTDELAICAEVSKIEADTHGCHITGATRIENLPVTSIDAAEIAVFLKHSKTGAVIPLRVERFKAPAPDAAKPLHDYSWASYRATISYVDLAVSSAAAGEWRLVSTIGTAIIERQAEPVSVHKALPSKQVGGAWIRVDGSTGALTVFSERASIVAEQAEFDEKGALQVQLYSKIPDLKAIRVRVSADSPFSDWPLGKLPKSLWRTTIPEEALKPFFNAKNEVALELLAMNAAGKSFRIKRPSTTPLSEHVSQDGSVHKTLESPYGNIFIRSEKNLNLASSISIFQGRLFLEGQVGSSAETPSEFCLRNVKTGALFPLPTTYWKNTFQSALDLLDVARAPLTRGPLPVGQYEFVFTIAGQATVLTALKDKSFQGLTPADGLQYKINVAPHSNSANLVHLMVMNRLAADESGEAAQARMRDQIYAPALLKGVKKVVMFDSFSGKRVDCNPFGIWREFSKVKTGLDLRFATADGSVILPKGVKPVKRWSKEYWELLGSSAMLITNDWLPKAVKRRKNQTIVQTWHGTPLKRIGFDIQQPSFDPNYHANLANDVAKWDILLSQNAFSTPHLRSAFKFQGEICEYGYPRNDLLRSPGADGIRAKLRAALRIEEKQTAMLYAPTWRDDQREGPGAYRLELGLDLDRLLREHPNMVILARWHHLTVPEARFSGHPRVLDVSAYPDIADLFLAADLLVTDYSSTMVDFSVTRKPILYFVPDLEKYTDKLRGFYVDFVNEVPGPLCKTTDELINGLGADSMKRLTEQYRGKYNAWHTKYCALDDGKAGYRMADRLLPLIL